MSTTTMFHRRATAVEGIQYTGPEMLSAVQDFLRPMSPAYQPTPLVGGVPNHGNHSQLLVFVRDVISEQQYPRLGIQYKLIPVAIGHYITRDGDGNIIVLSPEEIDRDFETVGGSVVDAVTVAGERLIASAADVGVFPLAGKITATHPRALSAAEPGQSER